MAAAVAGLLWIVPTPYVLRAPGQAEDVSEVVHIEGRPTYQSAGRFYLTTVIYERASLLHLLYALLRPDAELVPLADSPVRPDPRYQRSMQQQMRESQYNAQVAALTWLGYRIERHPRGVQVLDLLEGSPARGQLEPLDLITAVDGQPVLEVGQLQQRVRATPPGQRLRLEVVRGGAKRQVEVTVGLIGGRSALGVQVRTLEEPGPLPVRIRIEPGNINGASAGLIFALEILDQLTPGDLARGHRVAGTGTIEADGTVGPVAGVDMKVRAAEAAGAAWFLCPRANADEARSAARTLQVLPVDNLQQALEALAALPPR
jgi:PDZ domain-containing protein